jgi:hypothetical protein
MLRRWAVRQSRSVRHETSARNGTAPLDGLAPSAPRFIPVGSESEVLVEPPTLPAPGPHLSRIYGRCYAPPLILWALVTLRLDLAAGGLMGKRPARPKEAL